jgi:hypothetical protein
VIPRNHIIETTMNGYAEPGITPWPIDDLLAHDDLEPYEYNPDTAIDRKEFAGFIYCTTQPSSGFGIIICVVSFGVSILIIKISKRRRRNEEAN